MSGNGSKLAGLTHQYIIYNLTFFKYASQKFIHAISPTPASTMSSTELSTKPPNTTLSPYTSVEKPANAHEAEKRSADVANDSQYWRYDVSKRQKVGGGDGAKLCFKFVSSGSCQQGEKCYFHHDMDAREQSRRGVCFEFLNKGKCERGESCTYKHSLQEGDRRTGRCEYKLFYQLLILDNSLIL